MSAIHFPSALTEDAFLEDPHAAKYRGEIMRHPAAFAALWEVLNDPANEQRLVEAEQRQRPALWGVVHIIESHPAIAPILESGQAGHRFRQTIGVAVRIKMERLGWSKTGAKGAVGGARYFRKAERFTPDGEYGARALRALDAIARIGDDAEREETGDALMQALAVSRAAEGRVL